MIAFALGGRRSRSFDVPAAGVIGVVISCPFQDRFQLPFELTNADLRFLLLLAREVEFTHQLRRLFGEVVQFSIQLLVPFLGDFLLLFLS